MTEIVGTLITLIIRQLSKVIIVFNEKCAFLEVEIYLIFLFLKKIISLCNKKCLRYCQF